MSMHRKSLAALVACALSLPRLSAATPAAPNVIRSVAVADAAGGVEVAIEGSRAPSYTVFKLQDPPRLVVDLAGADVSGVGSPVAVAKGGVREVTTAQYQDAKTSVGRVIIGLEPSAKYEVTPRGDAVVVKVATSTSASTPPAPSSVHPERSASAAGAESKGPIAPAPSPVRPERSASAAGAESKDVLSRHTDEAAVDHPATAIVAARPRAGGLALALDGEIARFEVIELANPPRLAIDLFGVAKAPRSAVPLAGAFKQARFGRDTGKVRVVLDAASELPKVDVKRISGGLAVVPAPTSVHPERSASAAGAESKGEPHVVTTPPAAESRDEAPVRAETARAAAAGFTTEAPSLALSGAPQRREYQGRRITLDFHDIDIRNLLRLIADVSKKNVIVADNVSGKVTVALRNVPWDQALDLVLKAKGLDKEEMGNVIRIAKIEDIANEQRARAEAEKARAPLIPLKVRLIPVNFARAGDVQARVKEVLTERGTASVDERTNVIIVKDTQEALARAEGLVRNLDTEIPQVRIESRIVEASSNFNKAIGVQWGGNASFSPATGNPTGLFFPNVANTAGASGGGPTTGTSANPNYAVNLPAAIGQGSGGGLGFTFGSAGGAFNLNLRLSALENSGVVKTISAPSVSTIDNKEATIGQGISIPFSQVSASGVNTVFIEAKLELKVTPHISSDGSILMKIKVTNNSPNPQLTGANGQPSISKREAETEALVHDGDTTVIGGIYTRQTSSRVSEVPLFGKIPILGYFFRTKADQDDHTELLIFITPRILNRQATPVASGN
jgi:type IV pilus assembly protein PilQ